MIDRRGLLLGLTGTSVGATTVGLPVFAQTAINDGTIDDGSRNAPVGTPHNPTLFNGYSTRPPWKVAGVHYATGVLRGTVLKNPAVDRLPAGATYHRGKAYISIANTSNVTFDGWNFIGTSVEINVDVTGTVTFQNCRFINSPALSDKAYWVWVVSSKCPANFVFENCLIDFQAQTYQINPKHFFASFGSGTFTMRYCTMLNSCSQPLIGGVGAFLIQYSYFEGCSYSPGSSFIDSAHGEWTIFNGFDNSSQVCPLGQASFNTFYQPPTFGGGCTSAFYGAGTPNATITTLKIDHNTFIIKLFEFTGSVSDTTLTVTQSNTNTGFGRGVFIYGPGMWHNGIVSNGTGTGGVGTYKLSKPATVKDQTLYVAETSSVIGLDACNMSSIIISDNYVDCSGSNRTFIIDYKDHGGIRPLPIRVGNINLLDGAEL